MKEERRIVKKERTVKKEVLKQIIVSVATLLVIALCLGIALTVVGMGVFLFGKYPYYYEYYDRSENLCINPGLNDGFVCQGICAYEEGGRIFVSGYMKDDSPSRIYITDEDNNSYYVSVEYGSGKDFTGHSGGIAVSGDYAYVSSGDNIYAIYIQDIIDANNGDRVSIRKIIPVNNEASFIFADENYIYVGEFHDGKNYITDHPFYDPEYGINHAIVSLYDVETIANYEMGDEKTQPVPERIYSIRNKVQGICVTPEGKMIMATSYGLADSFYYVYDLAKATDSGRMLDGAPVYFLGNAESELRGPAMAEGLDYYDKKVITLTESASDKYIFGKFFFANYIVSIEF